MPGEIADMMLEGFMCEGCGEILGDGDGFPRRCVACVHGDDAAPRRARASRTPKTDEQRARKRARHKAWKKRRKARLAAERATIAKALE